MVLHLWCMTRLTILHLLCSTLRVTRAVQKPRLWQRGSLYIFLSVRLPLCIPLHASIKSVFIPPCESIPTRCTVSSSLGGGVGMSVHSWTFSPTRNLHACVHTFMPTPLILPPVLLSISVGSGVVRVDGCWQGLDCWGKDDGSSCRDRIAVSWDPLEGVIRLLWNLLPIRPSPKQGGGYSQMQCKVQVLSLSLPPIASSYLPLYFPLSHTNTHFLFSIVPLVPAFFSQHSLQSPCLFAPRNCFMIWRKGTNLVCFIFHEHIHLKARSMHCVMTPRPAVRLLQSSWQDTRARTDHSSTSVREVS